MTIVDILNIKFEIEIFKIGIDIEKLQSLEALYSTHKNPSFLGRHMTVDDTINIDIISENFSIEIQINNFNDCYLTTRPLLVVLH